MGHHRFDVFCANGVCPTLEALANLSFVGIFRCCHVFLESMFNELPFTEIREAMRASTRRRVPGPKFRPSEGASTISSPPSSRVIQTLPRRHKIRAPFFRYIRFARPVGSL